MKVTKLFLNNFEREKEIPDERVIVNQASGNLIHIHLDILPFVEALEFPEAHRNYKYEDNVISQICLCFLRG